MVSTNFKIVATNGALFVHLRNRKARLYIGERCGLFYISSGMQQVYVPKTNLSKSQKVAWSRCKSKDWAGKNQFRQKSKMFNTEYMKKHTKPVHKAKKATKTKPKRKKEMSMGARLLRYGKV
jgi:hypothetical protein